MAAVVEKKRMKKKKKARASEDHGQLACKAKENKLSSHEQLGHKNQGTAVGNVEQALNLRRAVGT